jgi:hypothetical protein
VTLGFMILTHALGLPPLRCYNAPKRALLGTSGQCVTG